MSEPLGPVRELGHLLADALNAIPEETQHVLRRLSAALEVITLPEATAPIRNRRGRPVSGDDLARLKRQEGL